MDNGGAGLRRGVGQRLEIIEFRLFRKGHVNRRGLVDQFGILESQASTNLNRYIGMASVNMVYGKSAWSCFRAPDPRHDTDPDARKPQDQQSVLINRQVIHENHG